MAHRAIVQYQSAFSKGHFILDGILCLHEVVHDLRFRGSKDIILKLDFEKVDDPVSWPFFCDVLLAKSFEGAYVHSLM